MSETTLRRPRATDIPEFVAALNDWAVAQWLVMPPYPYEERDGLDFLARAERDDAPGYNGKYVVTHRASGEFLGVVSLVPDGERAELGYWLKSGAWGKGYMADAARQLLSLGSAALPDTVFYATTDPENTRSERTLRSLGFLPVGTSRLVSRRKRGTIETTVHELPPERRERRD